MDRKIGALLVVLAWLTLPDSDVLADAEEEPEANSRRQQALERRLASRLDEPRPGTESSALLDPP
jgi:hypothetical protein